jgi:hypothetical protein
LARLAGGIIIATRYRVVDVTDAGSEADGIRWWEELTGRGGEAASPDSSAMADRSPKSRLSGAIALLS